MATQTTKRGLRKPELSDYVNVVTDINNNMDNLDNAVPDTRTVNGHALTSNVTVTKGDVGLGNVDNTSDVNKPVSTAQQTALDGKVPVTREINGHPLSANVTVTKSDVGLGNVDNTSDANKPISDAVAAKLGTVPSGKTLQGEIDATNSDVSDLKLAFNKIINTNNLFVNAELVENKYYYAGPSYEDTRYSYFIVPVQNGVTYKFNNAVRYISRENEGIKNTETPTGGTYTATADEMLYFTVQNNQRSRWAMCDNAIDIETVGTYDKPTLSENILKQETGNGKTQVMSQKATTDAINVVDEKANTNTGKLNNISETLGINMLDVSTKVTHKIRNDSGTEVNDSTSSYYNQYIPVVPGDSYYFNFGVQRIYEFDANKSNIVRRGAFNITKEYGAYVTPIGVYYIQIQVGDSSYNVAYAEMSHGYEKKPYYSYQQRTAVDNIARNINSDISFAKLLPLFTEINFWEPSSVDSGYSNPVTGSAEYVSKTDWTAEDKYTYYEFIEHYYDGHVGKYSDGYTVTKRSLGQDSSNTGYEIFEFDYCPVNYKYTVMLSAGMNANETQGIWALATFMRCVFNKEETNLTIARDNIRFKVIPIINASGFDTDPLRYNYSDGVNPNFNFNNKNSWDLLESDKKGAYPDSNIGTVILKKWVNDNSLKADLWIDLHTGRWPALYPNKRIIDIRVADASMVSPFNQYSNLIYNYYLAKGTISAGDSIGSTISIRDNLDYQKGVYAFDNCKIKSIMSEMHLESTGYSTDGFTNNAPAGIKCYVGQIRAMVMCYINESIVESLVLDSIEYSRVHERY